MTRSSVKEYAQAVRERYKVASRSEKSRILDEFTRITGYHRKAAIRLLGQRGGGPKGRRRGRRRQYGQEVTEALKVVWESTDRLCSKRLQPFLPELTEVLQRQGELRVARQTAEQLCRVSASTIDRLLRPHKRTGMRRPFSTTKPGSLLKASIPIRTFADWDEDRPGFVEVDLGARVRCGGTVYTPRYTRQPLELTHNKSYRIEYRCFGNNVTGRWHDAKQRQGICTSGPREIQGSEP